VERSFDCAQDDSLRKDSTSGRSLQPQRAWTLFAA
jgi:hypothetical protein